MMARSTNALQAEAGYIDARPHQPARGSLLHRTAGPYIRVIHVALVASVNRPHVRFASESDRIAAQQRNDAQCQQATYAPQQTPVYSISSSARASSVGGT